MDIAWRYPVIVQVVSRKGRDVFYGSCPDFGIETFEVVDPGNQTQEFMFHLKMRRRVTEMLSVLKADNKELPPIRPASLLSYYNDAEDSGSSSDKTISTSDAAKMLGVHADTIRRLFDSGSLAGALTKGGQRLISVKAINEEKEKMTRRIELRKLEARAKKTNSKRKARRIASERTRKSKSLDEEISSLTVTNSHDGFSPSEYDSRE